MSVHSLSMPSSVESDGIIDAPRSLDCSPQSGLTEIPCVHLHQLADWQATAHLSLGQGKEDKNELSEARVSDQVKFRNNSFNCAVNAIKVDSVETVFENPDSNRTQTEGSNSLKAFTMISPNGYHPQA
jgi:hypothetical protein